MKIFLFLLILAWKLFGSEYVLVSASNAAFNHLSQKQVRDIFMMKVHYVNGIKVIPINISASAPIRQVFEKNVLKIDRQRLNDYWIKEHFQGISPPLTQQSLGSIKMFLKNVEGAVGYIPTDMLDADLRVLYEF